MDWDSFNAWGTGNVDELRAYIGHLHRVRDDAHGALEQMQSAVEELLAELGQKRATNWEIVNDALVAAGKILKHCPECKAPVTAHKMDCSRNPHRPLTLRGKKKP
jgi:hypothetical protein